MADKSNKDHAREAARAHTSLNTFGTVVAILEGGLVYGGHGSTADATAAKIIKLCHAEMSKQLRIYDRHVAAIAKDTK